MMKMSSIQMFRTRVAWWKSCLFLLFTMSLWSVNAQDGAALFRSQCATCHQPHRDGTGPKLFEVRQKWERGGAQEGSIYQWVRNWQVAAANDPYAMEAAQWSPTAMSLFPNLTDEEIDAIFDYVDAQPLPGAATADVSGGGGVTVQQAEDDFSWIWIILGAIFTVIILSVGGVRRQLKSINAPEGEEPQTYADEIKQFVWNNRKVFGVVTIGIVLSVVVSLFLVLYDIGVVTAYQPSQPIEFPHSVHAGTNGIDCKYCHHSVEKSKSAGIPTVNVCMNCHKQVQGDDDHDIKQISKIYHAAGFSPDGGGQYSGETENIVWNKVHALPDHVYFSHAQHVNVGGIDCKQCHGDMTKQKELPRVVPVEELNEIDGNIKLTKPTLTMGWCIECHHETGIARGPVDGKGGYYEEIHRRLIENDISLYEKYLEDGKVTVSELGGWECAKCHY
jgi:cytochrome c551/c552